MNAQQPNLEIVGAGDEYIGDGYPSLRSGQASGDGYIEYIRNDDLNFQHLQAELLRIDLLIRRQVLGWQKAGQDPKDAFRGLYIADSEAAALVEHPLGANWGQFGLLTAEEEAWFARALEKASGRSSDIVEQAHAQGVTLCLDSLAAGFGWQPFDRETFLICAAPFLDLKYERLYGYLQDDVTRKRPTVNLVLDLLCPAGAQAMGTSAMGILPSAQDRHRAMGTTRFERLSHFTAAAPLFRYRFLEKVQDQPGKYPLLNQPLVVDESVVGWLLGQYQPRPEMTQFLRLGPGLDSPEKESLVYLLDARVRSELEKLEHQTPVVVFIGPDCLSQEAAAHLLAGRRGLRLLSLNLEIAMGTSGAEHNREGLDEILELALRDARMLGAGLFIQGWEACLEDGEPPVKYLADVCASPGMVILAGRSPWHAAGLGRERNLTWFEFPIPEYTQRRRLWQFYLERVGARLEGDQDLTSLAGQFQLTSGQIRDAVAFARDECLQFGTSLAMSTSSNGELFAAARAYSNPRLASLARKIAPRYDWGDIILPVDQLRLLNEIVGTVRERPRVLDEWGIGQKLASSRGVTVLFAGAPGTGKTMAAEVMAAELGLDLYKIDLSTVISKYIGETEKNLERIFNEAEASNAILFFDEADALFGKRSEVRDSHDRYANIEISYLLQRMEAYNGVTILATNLRSNLDEAFTRRLQFAVDFPFPEEADRLRIWKTLFPADVPREGDIDLALLARRFKLAGGNIRNILVTAAYLAASDGGAVNMANLLHGTRRELQKMGRLVGDVEYIEEDLSAG